MAYSIDELAVFLHLGQAYWRKKQMSDRDRMLILGGVAAHEIGLPAIAAYCRDLVLENNHGHMIRRWPDFQSALEAADFQHFIKQLKRKSPVEKAESVLSSFGIDLANERATYYTDLEYAAAILGCDQEWLQKHQADDDPDTTESA